MRYVLLSVILLTLCTAALAAPHLVTGSEAKAAASRLSDGTIHTLNKFKITLYDLIFALFFLTVVTLIRFG